MFRQCRQGALAILLLAALLLSALPLPAAAAGDPPVREPDADGVVEEAVVRADTLVLVATGDGGWWGDLDTDLGRAFAAMGFAVVGFDTSVYFDKARTPDEWGAMLAGLIERYGSATGARRIVLLGWSFGADVLPVGYNAMPEAARRRVDALVLLAPRQHTDLEVTLSGRIGLDSGDYAAADELKTLPKGILVCVKPDDEDGTACDLPEAAGATVLSLPGGHAFDHEADALAARLAPLFPPLPPKG